VGATARREQPQGEDVADLHARNTVAQARPSPKKSAQCAVDGGVVVEFDTWRQVAVVRWPRGWPES
jgi:hypothetical protein